MRQNKLITHHATYMKRKENYILTLNFLSVSKLEENYNSQLGMKKNLRSFRNISLFTFLYNFCGINLHGDPNSDNKFTIFLFLTGFFSTFDRFKLKFYYLDCFNV